VLSWADELDYHSGSTGIGANFLEAFELRSGVCQDCTHVILGMCRVIGVAARYAWCEAYLPGAGWIGFDPTNNTLDDE